MLLVTADRPFATALAAAAADHHFFSVTSLIDGLPAACVRTWFKAGLQVGSDNLAYYPQTPIGRVAVARAI